VLRTIIAIISLTLAAQSSFGQQLARDLLGDKEEIHLPFKMQNGFIVLDIQFNRFFPLRMIFDTGAEHTILFDKTLTDLLNIPYEREIRVMGSDLSLEMYAQIARNMSFTLSNETVVKRDIIVLNEDYLHLNENHGIDVNGIIGGEFFKGLVVHINYRKRRIELYNPDTYEPDKKFTKHEISIENFKPYIVGDYVSSSTEANDTVQLKLLLDTGAAITYLIFIDSDTSIVAPAHAITGHLGKGLGGDIFGLVGKSRYIGIEQYGFNEVITYFQDVDTSQYIQSAVNRSGLIGNAVLSRFDELAIDYTHQLLYLKPSKNYNKEFKYDKSGINMIAMGPNLKQYYVSSVLIDSPAYECGIRPGDLIKRYGWWSTRWYSLEGLSNRLCGDEGKEIKLTIQREDEKLKKSFILRDLLKAKKD